MAGVDEAGRGPLAGPVVAAAVILNPDRQIVGLADSKRLSEKKRESLFLQIQTEALDWAIAAASVAEIDTLNILQASLLAMRRAVLQLKMVPQEVQVDGNCCPDLPYACSAIIGGDDLIPAISAASILAKVTRDRLMRELDQQFPGYGFAQHKGYSTKMHRLALQQLGASTCHRKTFAPVMQLLEIPYLAGIAAENL